MKQFTEQLKTYGFLVGEVLVVVYAAYVVWQLYGTIYQPLLTYTQTTVTSPLYAIPDADIERLVQPPSDVVISEEDITNIPNVLTVPVIVPEVVTESSSGDSVQPSSDL